MKCAFPFVLMSTLTGCAAALAPQAAADFGCSEEQIVTEDVGVWFMHASGCDREDYYLYDHGQERWISLRERAAFELSCDKNALEVTMLDSVTFGVTGCEQKAVYKQLPYAGWVLDTVSQSGGPPVPAGREPLERPGPAPAPTEAPAPPPEAAPQPAPQPEASES